MIPEDPNKTKGENFVSTNDEANDLRISKGANAYVTEIQRLGKFRNDRNKQRVVLVTLANEHEARITLAKGREFRNNIYILPALTKDDSLKANQMQKEKGAV